MVADLSVYLIDFVMIKAVHELLSLRPTLPKKRESRGTSLVCRSYALSVAV